MGRYRPPAPPSSLYITQDGYLSLQNELNGLWKRRTAVTKALAAAAAEGDRSENAEYIYRKKELREIDRRIRYLQKRLPALTVVRDAPAGDAIYFGATVDLLDDQDRSHSYRIVGADEADAKTFAISMDSPLARALLGKHVDDDLEISVDGKTTAMRVTSIRYEVDE